MPTVHFSSLPCEVCHWPTSGNLRGPEGDELRVCDGCARRIDGHEVLDPGGAPPSAVRTATDATRPLVRIDSEIRQLAGELWGLYTPSAGTGPLYHGTRYAVARVLSELAPPCERCNVRPGVLEIEAYGYVSDFCIEHGLELIRVHDGHLRAVAVAPREIPIAVLTELHPDLPAEVLEELATERSPE